jgi:hypothetical protein
MHEESDTLSRALKSVVKTIDDVTAAIKGEP